MEQSKYKEMCRPIKVGYKRFYLWNRASIRRCADPSRWVISVTALSRVDDEGTLESALEEPG